MSSKKGVLNFVLIGAKSTGKTIYLSTLWGKGHLLHQGAEDKKYLTSTWKYIQKHGLAEATSGSYKELNFNYMHDDFGRIEFSMDDYDGTFTETVSEEDEHTKNEREKLFNSVNESEGIFFFLPYEKTLERLENFAQEIDAFINLAQFDTHNKSPIPASIIITKWDDTDEYMHKNEEEACLTYIKNNEHLNRAYTLIEKSFKQFKIIPLSSFKDYNLLEPIDYSLEKTFEQWFNRANELKANKEYKKLINYLTIRYFDTKFNEQYNFLALYNEAQEIYVKIMEQELAQKDTISDKEEYLEEVQEYYQTRKELLEPFYMALQKEKKIKKLKKARNIGVTLITLSSLAVAGVSYKNKLDVAEDYNSILDKYKKEAKNIDIKEDISLFFKTYPTQSSFVYAFSDIPKKREKITMIMNELDIKQREEIEKKEEKIVSDKNMTADEKKREIALLAFDASSAKQKQLNQKIKNFDEKTITDEWVNDVKECLKSCNNESDLERIDVLFKKLNNSQDIIRNREVEYQKKCLSEKRTGINKKIEQDKRDSWISKVDDCLKNCQNKDSFSTIDELQNSSDRLEKTDKIKKYEKLLVTKKSEIFAKIEEEEKRKKFEEEKSNELANLEGASSIDEIIEILLAMSEEFFKDETVHTKLLNTVKEIKKNAFQTEKGREHFKALEVSGFKYSFHSYLIDNVVPFIELKEEYKKLSKSIRKVETLNDFNNINLKFVKKFELFEQNSMKEKLNKKIDEIYDDIYDEKPSDKFELEGRRNWLNRIKRLNHFHLDNFNYSYNFDYIKNSEIKKIEDENTKIQELKRYGISGISVYIEGTEDNNLHFECGITSAGRSGEEVTITGFSSDLTSNEKYGECSNDTISFRKQIRLEQYKWYDLNLVEENYLHDYKFSTDMRFSLEELYNISQGKKIFKWFDMNRLMLGFKR